MRTTSTIARYLLALLFLTFGLNGFLYFLPMSPPTGVGGQFFGAMFVSHYTTVVFALQVIPALLLLSNRFVPLRLVLLGPIIVNIVLFHVLMGPHTFVLPLLAVVLWVLTFIGVRSAFAGIFQAKHTPEPASI